jgi:hypothetical protein
MFKYLPKSHDYFSYLSQMIPLHLFFPVNKRNDKVIINSHTQIQESKF